MIIAQTRKRRMQIREACNNSTQDNLNMQYLSGQITILAALSLVLMMSLVCTCIRSASLSSTKVRIDEAVRLTTESIFAGYSNEVLDEFDIFILKNSDIIDAKAKAYLSSYIEKDSDFKDVTLLNASLDEKSMMTDNGGENIKKQVLAYMNYGIYADIYNNITQTQEQIERADKVSQITEKIIACEDALFENDSKILELVELVEGIQTNDSGIVIRGGNPVAVFDGFVKSSIYGELNKTSAAINNDKVYKAVAGLDNQYADIQDLLKYMIIDAKELYEIGDEDSDLYGNDSYAELYKRGFTELKNNIITAQEKTTKALEVIQSYNSGKQDVQGSLMDCKGYLDSNSTVLGTELYDGFLKDLDEMEQSEESTTKKMCDVDAMYQALMVRNDQYQRAQYYIQLMDTTLLQSNSMTIKGYAEECQKILGSLSNDGLVFDYSNVDFDSDSEGISAIKKVYQTLTDGILGLVIDGDISDKKIQVDNLATTNRTGEFTNQSGIAMAAKDTALYDEYLFMKFGSYIDQLEQAKEQSEGKTQNQQQLVYVLEYILNGHDTDRENLKETVMKLSLLREGMNLAYLFTDAQKKSEAFTLATSLLGFTGNMAIIKSGQYLIMTVWAYAESIVELKQLYKGEKVEFIKTKDNWNVTLSNAIAMKFDTDKKENERGIDYEGYLKMLLLVQNESDKYYRTLSAMELRMIELGKTDFRMKDYVFSATGTATFQIKRLTKVYAKTMEYHYA